MSDPEILEPAEPLYSPKSLAKRLDITPRTAWQYMRDGVIPSFRIGPAGKSLRAHPEDVERYIATQRGEGS